MVLARFWCGRCWEGMRSRAASAAAAMAFLVATVSPTGCVALSGRPTLGMAHCAVSDPQQKWALAPDGGAMTLEGDITGCVERTCNGCALELAPCAPGSPAQQWKLDEETGAIVQPGSDPLVCLDLRLTSTPQRTLDFFGATSETASEISERATTDKPATTIRHSTNAGSVDGYYPCHAAANITSNERWIVNGSTGQIKTSLDTSPWAGQCVTAAIPSPTPPPSPPPPSPVPPAPWTGSLVWPKPWLELMSGDPIALDPGFSVLYSGESHVLTAAAARYTAGGSGGDEEHVEIRHSSRQATRANAPAPRELIKQHQPLTTLALVALQLEAVSSSDTLTNWTVDESYSVSVTGSGIAVVKAKTPFGALRGCETFSQLLTIVAQTQPLGLWSSLTTTLQSQTTQRTPTAPF
jgi:hypothetical protein